MGTRPLAIGVMIVTLSLSNQTKALGYIMLIGGIVPLTCFLVFSQSIGVVSAMCHAAPVPFIFGLDFCLLSHLKNDLETWRVDKIFFAKVVTFHTLVKYWITRNS